MFLSLSHFQTGLNFEWKAVAYSAQRVACSPCQQKQTRVKNALAYFGNKLSVAIELVPAWYAKINTFESFRFNFEQFYENIFSSFVTRQQIKLECFILRSNYSLT
jgi:hypothetical protein